MATTGYVDPKWGTAPAGGSYSLDPQKGWVPMQGSTVANQPAGSTTSPTGIINTALNSGFKFVNNGGTDTLVGDKYAANLHSGAASYNAATGQNLTDQQYDAMINPKDSGTMFNADGTRKTYGAGDYITPSVTEVAAPGSAATPNAAGGAGGGSLSAGGAERRGRGIVGGAAGYTPWTVTPDQTVEGRIQSIVNGAIGTQARTDATEQMAARGLQNSDLAISAGEQAAYAAAVPIAQADAATAAKAAGYDADIQNQMTMQGNQLGSQEKIAQLQSDTQRYGYDTNAATQKYTADLNARSQQLIAGMDNDNRVQIQQLQNDNQRLLQTNSNAASAFNQSMVAVANIEQNTTMDANAKTQAIAQIMQNLQQQLTTLGKVSSIDLSGTLNFASMPGFDAQGHWVGFGGSSAGSGAGSTSDSGYQGPVFQPSN